MKLRLTLAAAATLAASLAQADITYIPCEHYSDAGGLKNYNCTAQTPGTGFNGLTHQMEQAVYTDEYGQQRVATVPKYLGATCKDNTCGVVGAHFQGEFVGNAPRGFYLIPRGWYLGPANDGSPMAYQAGTGPRHGQPAGIAPQRKPQEVKPRLSPNELKAAIRTDRKYNFSLVYSAEQSTSKKMVFVGVLAYQGQTYMFPSDQVLDYVPIYRHEGERLSNGDPLFKNGSNCDAVSGLCKDSSGNVLGLADYKVEDLMRQGILPSVPTPVTSAEAQPVVSSQETTTLTGEACYEHKLAAFHKENGEEAMVIMDQINEWQEQCGLPPSY